MVIYLGLLSPAGSSDLPESRRAAVCSLFGLASDGVYMCPVCYQPGGSLLHCPSTLTRQSRAVHFCCTVLGVASTGCYPAPCPVKPGLSSSDTFRTVSRDHLSYSLHKRKGSLAGFLHSACLYDPLILSQFALCQLCQSLEAFSIVDSHVSQDLSVHLNASQLQAVHEFAVG